MIRLDGVGKTYDGGRTAAVQDVTLSVGAGELFVLLGESGSGKTTTLKMVNRLIEPSGGTVRIAGEDASALPGHLLHGDTLDICSDGSLPPCS